jgi:hypothetical protein
MVCVCVYRVTAGHVLKTRHIFNILFVILTHEKIRTQEH